MTRFTVALTLGLSVACAPGPTTDEPSFAFGAFGAFGAYGECRDRSELQYEDVTFRSFHIPMRDGVRIAFSRFPRASRTAPRFPRCSS